MFTFPFHYLTWHYTEAIRDIVGIIRNFLWFFVEFFSIKLLLKTFFQPFRRLNEGYKKGFNLSEWAQTFIINVLMRTVGAAMRFLLIIVGIFMIVLTAVAGLFFLIAWILAPLLLVILIGAGFMFIVTM